MTSEKYRPKLSEILLCKEFLGVVLLASCIGLSTLLYGVYYLVPQYKEQIIHASEGEAYRMANHLEHHFHSCKNISAQPGGAHLAITEEKAAELDAAAKDFGLFKLSIFDSAGQIIYSTTKDCIGSVNAKPYFADTVAKGEVHSSVVQKEQQTPVGLASTRNVLEMYVPIMHMDHFLGATKVFLDMSGVLAGIQSVHHRSLLIYISMSALLLAGCVFVGFQSARSKLYRKRTETDMAHMYSNLQHMVFDQTRELKLTQECSVEALAALAEYYDYDTGGHLRRIQGYVRCLTDKLRQDSPVAEYLNKHTCYFNDMAMAAILHDIGKTAIPREILTKPGKLNPDEYELVKQHTVVAGEVLAQGNAKFLRLTGKDSYLALAREIAVHHHERWDGKGYPLGLSQEAIPLSARIVAVADVYDALRSVRPYKDGWPHQKTVDVIKKDSGTAFDPMVVEAFLSREHEFAAIFDAAEADDRCSLLPTTLLDGAAAKAAKGSETTASRN